MKKLKRVLRSRSGATLTELLISVAILGIVFSAIVVGVNSAVHVFRRSVAVSDAQTLTSTLTDALAGELRFARNIRSVGGEVVFDSDVFGAGVSVKPSADGKRILIGNAAKDYELLSEGSYMSGLNAAAGVSYTGGVFTVTLTISGSDLAPRVTTLTVRALNV